MTTISVNEMYMKASECKDVQGNGINERFGQSMRSAIFNVYLRMYYGLRVCAHR